MHSFKMTQKDLHKLTIINQLESWKLNRKQASDALGVTARQVDRIRKAVRKKGPSGIVHGNRGRPSNRRKGKEFEDRVLNTIRQRYPDFKPTLAREKLAEHHGIEISKEKLRQLMTKHGLWAPKQRRQKRCHSRRPRRCSLGELLQGDGSHHLWFEDRGPRSVLVAFIDDATSRVYGRFYPSETTEAYTEVMGRYITKYGRPMALYVDKDSIFRNNKAEGGEKKAPTQFHRMMIELGIELICAHSPQAKGRIERLFGMLQDRLIKEMRLRGITSIEDANAFLEKEYWDEFNTRWMVEAACKQDVHQPCPGQRKLKDILALRYTRKVSRSLDFSYNGVIYQVQTKMPHRLVKQSIQVRQYFDGSISAEYDGAQLTLVKFGELSQPVPTIDTKEINAFLDKKRPMTAIQRHRKKIRCI